MTGECKHFRWVSERRIRETDRQTTQAGKWVSGCNQIPESFFLLQFSHLISQPIKHRREESFLVIIVVKDGGCLPVADGVISSYRHRSSQTPSALENSFWQTFFIATRENPRLCPLKLSKLLWLQSMLVLTSLPPRYVAGTHRWVQSNNNIHNWQTCCRLLNSQFSYNSCYTPGSGPNTYRPS